MAGDESPLAPKLMRFQGNPSVVANGGPEAQFLSSELLVKLSRFSVRVNGLSALAKIVWRLASMPFPP
jgi:hypothetical protein